MFLLLTSNIFHTFFQCFYRWLWSCECHLGTCPVVVCMKTSWNLPDIYSKNEHKTKQRTLRGSCPEVLLKNWKSSLENMCARATFLNKAADLETAIALKERHRHMCFSGNFEKFLRKIFERTSANGCFWKLQYFHSFIGLFCLKYSPATSKWCGPETKGQFTTTEEKYFWKENLQSCFWEVDNTSFRC